MSKKIQVLRVVSKREGFRRAGIAFGSEPVNLTQEQLEKLSEEQMKSIRDDPALLCVVTEIDAPEESDVDDSRTSDASASTKAGKK